MKYTKADIEKFVNEVFKWASSNKIGHDFGLYYGTNVKQWHYSVDDHKYIKETKTDINPLDYCEWFDKNFIAGMWYDGEAYECLNGYSRAKAYAKLEALAEKYGLYIEHCDSVHCGFCPIGNLEDYEYTRLYKEEPEWIYYLDCVLFKEKLFGIIASCIVSCAGDLTKLHETLDNELESETMEGIPDMKIGFVMWKQFEMAKEIGEHGACTIGEYIEFRYKGKLYRMCMQTPYQGEGSWRGTLTTVVDMLGKAGASEIHVNYGRLD